MIPSRRTLIEWKHLQATEAEIDAALALFKKQEDMNAKRWVFDGDLACKSFAYVAEKAPNADAYLINGMCNFINKVDGLPQRPVHLETKLEAMLGKPIVGHDTALYWRMMQQLGIAPTTDQGELLRSLK